MDKLLKASIYIMIFLLLAQLFPTVTFAQDNEAALVNNHTEVLLFATEKDGQIELFEDESAEKVISTIPDSALVELLDLKEEYSEVLFTPDISDDESDSSHVALTGFVQTIHVVNLLDKDDFLEKRKDENFILKDYGKNNSEENMLSEEVNKSSETINDFELENQNREITTKEEARLQADTEEVIEAKQRELRKEISKDIELDKPTVPKKKTEDQLEVQQSGNNEITSNKIFSVSTFSSTAVSQVSNITLKGIALGTSTKIYSQTSTASSVLKSYKQGHILLFQSHNSNWYIATVYIGGKPQTGYINVNDVDVLVEQQRLVGYGLVQPVHVYQSPKRNNGVLKSYNRGARLIYRTFSSQWHEATVIINGKTKTGYIHVNDVGPLAPVVPAAQAVPVPVVPVTLAPIKGVAISKLVSVYSTTSTNSTKLKTYSQGHVLLYRPFNSAWHEATVYVNGKARKGYINRNDVEDVVSHQKTVRGIAINGPTRVYSKASTSSKTLKSYSIGKGLIYRTFTNSWYEATVYVNGKPTTGYIHKNHVVDVNGKVIVLDPGHGGSDSGAQASGIIEKELNLDIALRTKSLLENAGFSVIMTRTTDTYVSLAGRAAIANISNADIFISIHGNAFNRSARGVETFWYGKFEKANSMRLANLLQNNVVSKTNISNRRVAEGNFHVIRETEIPSALVEVGFIDNPSDAAKLKQSKYRQLAAEGIMLGVLDYFR
jgi:N-acetylmuramoyl-L-alanine amidase